MTLHRDAESPVGISQSCDALGKSPCIRQKHVDSAQNTADVFFHQFRYAGSTKLVLKRSLGKKRSRPLPCTVEPLGRVVSCNQWCTNAALQFKLPRQRGRVRTEQMLCVFQIRMNHDPRQSICLFGEVNHVRPLRWIGFFLQFRTKLTHRHLGPIGPFLQLVDYSRGCPLNDQIIRPQTQPHQLLVSPVLSKVNNHHNHYCEHRTAYSQDARYQCLILMKPCDVRNVVPSQARYSTNEECQHDRQTNQRYGGQNHIDFPVRQRGRVASIDASCAEELPIGLAPSYHLAIEPHNICEARAAPARVRVPLI